MKSDFNRVRKIPVGTVCTSISDTFKGNAQQVVLVNTSDVLEGKVLNHQSVPNKNLRGQFKKTFCKEDILYSEIRPQNKRFAFVDFSPCNYIASTKLMVLRADQQQILPRYLYYFLTSNLIIAELQMLAETRSGTFPQITFSELANITIPVPLLDVQQSIVDIVKCIDDKIELNQKINENLEQQIFALFQAKYKYPSSGICWKTGCVGDVVNLQRGYDLPKNQIVDGIYPVAGSTDTIAYHTTFTSEPPCIIMGRSGNIGRPRLYLQKCWAHNTTLFSKEFKNSNPYWVYTMLRSIDYRQFQGGSAVPTLNRNHVHAFPIDIPSKEKQDEFGKFAFTLFQTIKNNIEENNKLHKFRDTLLPKLMAGEIDIRGVNI